MTKRFLKIISASAAAALTLALGACSENAAPIEEEKEGEHIAGENKLHLAVNVAESAKDYNNMFEKVYDEYYQTAVLEQQLSADYQTRLELSEHGQGRSPYDVASYTSKLEAHARCGELGVCKTLELEPVQDPDSRIWAGSFEVDSIENASAYLFTLRNTITCTVGGNTCVLESKPGYYGVYKEAGVELTYDDGTVSRERMGNNNSAFSVSAPKRLGTITKASYEFVLFNGDNSSTGANEIVRIELIKK